MAARKRIAAGISRINIVPLRRIRDVQIEIAGLRCIGALVKQTLRESKENSITGAENGFLISSDIPGKANARSKIFPILPPYRLDDSWISWKHESQGSVGRDDGLFSGHETDEGLIQINRRNPRIPPKTEVQGELARYLPVV